MDKLLDKEPELKKIVFHSSSLKISNLAWAAVVRALNERRPFCSWDCVPQTFIADMHRRDSR